MPTRLTCLMLCFAFALTGCAPIRLPLGATTIEDAARSWVLRDPQSQAQSVVVRQMQMIGQGAVVLATYTTVQDGHPQKSAALVFITPSAVQFELFSQQIRFGNGGWHASSGVRSARDAHQPPPPLHTLFASDSAGRYDAIGGEVADPAVQRVAIVFSNGIRRIATVTNGAYVAAQASRYTVLKIEALDAQGRVLHEE